MPPIPSIGMYLPGNGFVNAQNSQFADGTGDPVTGLGTYQGGGLYPGRMIQLSDAEAATLDVNATTTPTLYGGSYQWVQMDSGASTFLQGQCLFWKLHDIANGNYVVTNSAANNEPCIAGVYVNPAAYPVTPGYFFLMFVSAPGRVQVLCKSSFTGTAAGRDPMVQTAAANTFDDLAGVTAPTMAQVDRFVGISESIPTAGQLITVQWQRTFERA